MGKMTTIKLEHGKWVTAFKEQNTEPAIEELQQIVGGWIEIVDVLYQGQRAQMIVNEEGHIHELPFNPVATEVYQETAKHVGHPTQHWIAGNVVILQGKEALLT